MKKWRDAEKNRLNYDGTNYLWTEWTHFNFSQGIEIPMKYMLLILRLWNTEQQEP